MGKDMHRGLAVLTVVLSLLVSLIGVRPPAAVGQASDYHTAWVSQSPHPTIPLNGCNRFEVKFKNTGTAIWYRGIVHLGTDRPQDRIPGFIREDRCTFQASGWVSGNRVEMQESAVSPGGIATFVFWYTVPSTHALGTFHEYFRPVADGITWMEDWGVYWDVTVFDPGSTPYHAAYVGQNGYPTLKPNECYRFEVRFENVGTAIWYPNVVHLGTDQPRDRIPGFIREDRCTGQPSGWVSPNRVTMLEPYVMPGGIATFVFWYTVPADHAGGVFREYFRPVADGVTWMEDFGVYWDVEVTGVLTPRQRIVREAFRALNPAAYGGSTAPKIAGNFASDWNYLWDDYASYTVVKRWYESDRSASVQDSFYTAPQEYGFSGGYGHGGQCKYFANLVLNRSGVFTERLPSYDGLNSNANRRIGDAKPGDVIFRWKNKRWSNHVAIVVAVLATDAMGRATELDVVDSNNCSNNCEIIQRHPIKGTELGSFSIYKGNW